MLTSRRATNILLVLMLAVGIAVVAMLATDVRGGPLDPASEPAPTLRPLDELQGAWNIKLPADDGIVSATRRGSSASSMTTPSSTARPGWCGNDSSLRTPTLSATRGSFACLR